MQKRNDLPHVGPLTCGPRPQVQTPRRLRARSKKLTGRMRSPWKAPESQETKGPTGRNPLLAPISLRVPGISDSIPQRKYQQTVWFQPWFQSGAKWISSAHSRDQRPTNQPTSQPGSQSQCPATALQCYAQNKTFKWLHLLTREHAGNKQGCQKGPRHQLSEWLVQSKSPRDGFRSSSIEHASSIATGTTGEASADARRTVGPCQRHSARTASFRVRSPHWASVSKGYSQCEWFLLVSLEHI